MDERTVGNDKSPAQVNDEALDFLKTKRNDSLDDFATQAEAINTSIISVEEKLASYQHRRGEKSLSKTEKDLLAIRIAEAKDLLRRLKSTRGELSQRLSDFREKTIGTLRVNHLRSASKDTKRRQIWKAALQKNLMKLPAEIVKKATSARMEHTKAKWVPAKDEMIMILNEESTEYQREAADKFLKRYEPTWAAKLHGDADYRNEMLDVLINSIKEISC